MSSNIAIRVTNLSKRYEIYATPRDRLKQFFLPRLQRIAGNQPMQYFKDFWALKDISFDIKKGETVGIIGRNGSGKSTLLQLICGTLNPTSGNIQVNGRIAALLELGSGFNHEFTGRENIYMSCTLLGMTQQEINNRFDEIAAFADIGDFLEQPVKTYSSGMFVRLAFAVNIMSRPDIMVVDEALAVGDMNFQAKCMTALNRIKNNGSTILFVSHDVGAVKSLCSRGIYLEKGAIKSIGNAPEVAELYIRTMREEMNAEEQNHAPIFKAGSAKSLATSEKEYKASNNSVFTFKNSEEFEKQASMFRYGSGGARITFADLIDEENHSIRHVEFGQKIGVKICFITEIEEEISCNYYVADDKKNLIIGSGMKLAGREYLKSKKDGKYVVVYWTEAPLGEGNYSIQLQLTKPLIVGLTAEFLDVIDDAIVFSVALNPLTRVWTKVSLPNKIEVYQE